MRHASGAPLRLHKSKQVAAQISSTKLRVASARHRHRGAYACAYPGKPQILREPATRNATLRELLVEISGLPTSELQQLVDLGAVYYGDPECPANPPKWRRAKRLGAAAMDQHIAQVFHLQLLCRPWLQVPASAYWPLAHLFNMVSSPCRAFCCYTAPHFTATLLTAIIRCNIKCFLCRGSGSECTPGRSGTQQPTQLTGNQPSST